MQKVTTCVYNGVEEYTQVPGKCPYCDAQLVFRNNSIILTSNPPQSQYRCKGCGKVWSAFNDSEAVKKEDSPMFSAEWTNADSLDNSILNGPKIGDAPGNDNYWAQQGWVCPRCGAVLSPWTMECPHCRPGINRITTSPNTSNKFPDDYVTYLNSLPKTYSSDASTHSEPNPNITAQC